MKRPWLTITALGAMALHAAGAAGLSAEELRIVAAADARAEASIALLAEAVGISSATENHTGVALVGEVFARELRALGFETRWVDMRAQVGRAGHLVATRRGDRGQRLLLIGHLDTVLGQEAFRREGMRAMGSGVSDMKGGDVIIVEALRALAVAGALEGRQITVVMTGDEEDPGSPTAVTRQPLIDAARDVDVVLAFEGAVPGMAVIGRRGIATWWLTVNGRQGHSSQIFREGYGDGAIFETARILERFHRELQEPYLSFNPAVIVGGTEVEYDRTSKRGTAQGKTNVIPRDARVEGDLRYLSAAQFERATAMMQAIVAQHLPQTSATLEMHAEYPSMAPSDANRAVLAVLDGVSRDLGAGPIVAQDPGTRGAGDISFVCNTGRLGCLDGLGSMGGNEHAPGEWIDLEQMLPLTRRAALLMHRLAH